jgi:hypothetical protein
MGVDDNQFQISDLTNNTSFFDWASKTNTEIINKLNRLKVYDGISGDGINLVVGATASTSVGSPAKTIDSGDLFVELSGSVSKGMTFGNVTINGLLSYDFTKNFSGVPLISMKLTGGTAGVTTGHVMRYATGLNDTRVSSSNFDGLTFAKADSIEGSEVFGIVKGISGNSEIEVVVAGQVDGFKTTPALSAGCVHFLDPSVAGGLTSNEPNIVGHVSKPVLIATDADTGVFYNFRGQKLGATGGTGDFQADNNAFFIDLGAAQDGNGIPFEKGKVVSYLSESGTFECTRGNRNESVSQMIGVIVADRTTIGGNFAKIACGGFVSDSPVSKVGPLFVNNEGTLVSEDTGGLDTVFGMGLLNGADYSLIVTFNTGDEASSGLNAGGVVAASTFNSGFGGSGTFGGFFAPSANKRPQFSRTAAPVVLGATAATGGAIYVNKNELVNGSMELWQRGVGTVTPYTGTGGTYFADRWVRVDGSTATSKTYSIQRKEFSNTQTDVEGNPNYYVRTSHTASPTSGIRIENRIEGVETLRGENVCFSFYAKSGTSGATATVFWNQNYGNTSDVSNLQTTTDLGNIYFENDWTKYITVFGVPELTHGVTFNNSFASVGIHNIPSGVQIDIAQAKLERGNLSTPVEPRRLDEEYNLAARYYQRSYSPEIPTRQQTFTNNEPDATSINFTAISPDSDFYHRFPVLMRGTPTVTLYAPNDGTTGDAYNRTAAKTMSKTSGSSGKDRLTRIAPTGKSTISSVSTKDGLKINALNGFVNFDNISVHYVADADLNIDID